MVPSSISCTGRVASELWTQRKWRARQICAPDRAVHERRSAALKYETFEAHWRDRTTEDAFVTFSLNPDRSINSARLAAVSPLETFTFDYQYLLLKPAEKKP
jgi:hypothetical protein